ncbi:MAG: GNAT family N-acetyltransferase [Saprospiraceae bacterium]|nr:GNAT family N-acetyltransferase [Saprospiraceae bacterium]
MHQVSLYCKPFEQLSPSELYKILQLRTQVFVIEQNCIYLDLDDKDQLSSHVWLAGKDGQILAYGRVIPPGVSYEEYASIGRIASALPTRREGWGRKICKECLSETEKQFPGIPIKISAQSYLIPFYESFGFVAKGEDYLEDNIPHRAMVRKSLPPSVG